MARNQSDIERQLREIGQNPSELPQQAGEEFQTESRNPQVPDTGTPAAPPQLPQQAFQQEDGSLMVDGVQLRPQGQQQQQEPPGEITVDGVQLQALEGNEFTRGVRRGIGQTQALGHGSLAAMADLVGADEFAEDRAQDYQRIMSTLPPATIERVEDVQSPGDAASYMAGILGEQTPVMAGFMVSGGLGALAGKALSTAARKKLRTEVSENVRKQLADKVKDFGRRGALAGGYTYGQALGTGEIYGEQVESGVETSPGTALLGGQAIGALDVLPMVNLARGIGLGDRAKNALVQSAMRLPRGRRAAVMGALIGGQEMGTEAAQETIAVGARDFVDENFSYLDPEVSSRIMNAAVAGGLVGGTTGTLAGGIGRGERSGEGGPAGSVTGLGQETSEGATETQAAQEQEAQTSPIDAEMDVQSPQPNLFSFTEEGVQQEQAPEGGVEERPADSPEQRYTKAGVLDSIEQLDMFGAQEEQPVRPQRTGTVDVSSTEAPAGPAIGKQSAGVYRGYDARNELFTLSRIEGAWHLRYDSGETGSVFNTLTEAKNLLGVENIKAEPPAAPARSPVENAEEIRTEVSQDPHLVREEDGSYRGRDASGRAITVGRDGKQWVARDSEGNEVDRTSSLLGLRQKLGPENGRLPLQTREERIRQKAIDWNELPEEGMTREAVQEAIAPIQFALPGAPNVWVGTASDFQVGGEGFADVARRSKGVYVEQNGRTKIALVADNLTSAEDAQRTYLHEVVGHAGIRRLFNSEELVDFLKQVRGPDDNMSLEQAEEKVARVAESGASPSWFERVVALVRRALRRIVPNLAFSDSEIRNYLSSAAGMLTQRGPASFSSYFTRAERQEHFATESTTELLPVVRTILGQKGLRKARRKQEVRRNLLPQLADRERIRLEMIMSRLAENEFTYEQLAWMYENLRDPLTVREETIEGLRGIPGYRIYKTIIDTPRRGGVEVFRDPETGVHQLEGVDGYFGNRVLRELYRQAAARSDRFFRVATDDPAAQRYLRNTWKAKEKERYFEVEVNWEDDFLPKTDARVQVGTLIRQSAMDSDQQSDALQSIHRHSRLWSITKWKFAKWMMTPLQIAQRYNVPWVDRFKNLLEEWQNTKLQTIELADRRVSLIRKLGKDAQGRLSRALIDSTTESFRKGRRLNDGEMQQHTSRLSAEEMQVFQDIRSDFRMVLDRMERSTKHDIIRRTIGDLYTLDYVDTLLRGWEQSDAHGRVQLFRQIAQQNPNRAEQINKLVDDIARTESEFQSMRNRDYFPLMRFGKYAIVVRNQEGKMEEFHTYDGPLAREQALGQFKGKNVQLTKISDTTQSFLNFPPALQHRITGKLSLDDSERALLDELFNELAPGRAFVKRMLHRKGTPGFSEDMLRVYSSYMFNAANHIARIEHGQKMEEELSNAEREITRGGHEDSTILGELRDYFSEEYNYIMNPGEEFAGLRSAGFLYYLGFSPKSAFVNMTQVPMIGYPYLAQRYGDAKAVGAITKALSRQSKTLLGRRANVPEELDGLLEELRRRGITDQSQVSALAAFTEGSNLQRVLPETEMGRFMSRLSYAGGWLFHNAELYNRRVMADASWQLASAEGKRGNEAADIMHNAVRATQFEYSRWNRPQFMRGKLSPVFLFWQYMQNAMYVAHGGEGMGTAVRMWAMLGLSAGLMGLPWAEDLMDLFSFGGTQAKKALGLANPRVDLERDLHELTASLTDNPDLWMNGAGRYYGLGPLHVLNMLGVPMPNVDISASLTLGNVLPGTELLNQPNAGLGNAVEQIGGPVFQMGSRAFYALGDDNPDTWKRMERAFPMAARNASKAARRWARGEETTRGGAQFLDYEPEPGDTLTRSEANAELIAQAFGFAPTRQGKRYDLKNAQWMAAQYHMNRRSMLMETFAWARQQNDQEALADARKAIRKYNASVPVPTLKITYQNLQRSLSERRRRRLRAEAGLPPENRTIPLYRQMEDIYEG